MKAIIATELRKRISDKYGAGHFGASRTSRRPDGSKKIRKHNGIDYLCPPESQVLSPVTGKITKLGYAYKKDENENPYRYVQVTASDGKQHRVFYVEPILPLGRRVREGDIIGFSQDLGKRYPGITDHVHYEIIHEGKYINPEG